MFGVMTEVQQELTTRIIAAGCDALKGTVDALDLQQAEIALRAAISGYQDVGDIAQRERRRKQNWAWLDGNDVSDIEGVRALTFTPSGKALFIRLDRGGETSVPRSWIQPGSEVNLPGDYGVLKIPRWAAKDKGFIS
jgi:hypothetical protein